MKKMPAFLLIVLFGCAKNPIVPKEFSPISTDSPTMTAPPAFSPTPYQMASETPEAFTAIKKDNLDDLQELTTWWGFSASDIDLSPDGSYFLVARPGGIYFYDPDTAVINSRASGNAISEPQGGEIRLIAEKSPSPLISISPDGLVLATGSQLDSIWYLKLWNVSNGSQLWSQEVKDEFLQQVLFSPDSKSIASESISLPNYDNPVVRTWNASDGLLRLEIRCPVMDTITFSKDGASIITGNTDGNIFFFNTQDGKMARRMPGHSKLPISFTYNADGAVFLSGSMDGTLIVWEMPDYKLVRIINIGHWPESLAFLPESSILISGSDDALRFIDVSSGEIIREIKTEFNNKQVIVINKGKIIASRSYGNGSITFWGIPNI